jgi:hypothetical protein
MLRCDPAALPQGRQVAESARNPPGITLATYHFEWHSRAEGCRLAAGFATSPMNAKHACGLLDCIDVLRHRPISWGSHAPEKGVWRSGERDMPAADRRSDGNG